MIDLTDDVMTLVAQLNDNKPQKKKLLKTLKLLETYKLKLVFYNNNNNNYSILLQDEDELEVGYFSIFTHSKFTLMMSISVDDEYLNGKLRKTGLSRLLVTSMVFVLQEKLRKDQLLFIDVDASYSNEGKSFWDHIGMKFCRFDKEARTAIRKTNLDGAGCEKMITYTDLSNWAIGVPMGNNQIIVCSLFL
jgi:hypothetical protein